MTAAFPYQRLPGTRRGLIRKAALWEGTDHLFSVTGTRFSEQYRRFYYRDIQALIIRRCPQPGSIGIWLLTIFFSGLFAFLGSIFSPINGASKWLHFTLWTVSSVGFLYLLYRLVVSLKYGCRCYIQTAVTWEELPSLYRTWNAQKALARIRTKIGEAQGALAGDPQALLEGVVQQGRAERPNFSEAASMAKGEMGRMEADRSAATGLNLALLGCIALLAIAAFLFWYMNASVQSARRSEVLLANALATFVAGGGFLLSLLRIYKVRALHPLRNFLLAALGLIGLHVYFSVLLSSVYPQAVVLSAALGSPAFRRWFSLIDGSFALLFGLLGVALIVFNRQRDSKGAVSNA